MRTRRGWVALVATVTAVGVVGLRGKLRRYEIVERSMEPNLHQGDYVVAQARGIGLARGDVVIVPHPGVGDFILIKRVVGLPGETITLRDGMVHVDGAALAEPWANGPVHPDGEWQLGETQVFVLGDNRSASAADSRTIGPVRAATIEWKVVARYWPLNNMGRLSS